MRRILLTLVFVVASLAAGPAAAADGGLLEKLFSAPGVISNQYRLADAIKAYEAGRFDDAIALCDKVIETGRISDELLSEAYSLRAFASRRAGRGAEGLENIEQAIALAPRKANHHRIKAILLLSLDRPSEAIAPARRALALDPEVLSGRAILGLTLYGAQEWQEAVSHFALAAEETPESYTLAMFHLLALFNGGNLEEVVVRADHVFSLAPQSSHFDVQAIKASALMELRRDEEALAAAEHLAELKPSSPIGHHWAAVSNYRLKRFEAALPAFERYFAIAEEPDPRMHYFRGRSLIRLQRFAEAIPDLEIYRQVAPDNDFVHQSLGRAHFFLGEREAAKESFERAISLDPEHCCVDWYLGMLAYFAGDDAAAEAVWRRDMARHRHVYLALWLALIAERRGEDAVAVLDSALEGAAEIENMLAVVAAFRGGSEQAAIEAAEAAGEKRAKHLCETYVYLAERALIQGRRQQAIAWFGAAVETGATTSEIAFAQWRLDQLATQN